MPVIRLALTDFRNHADALIEPGPGFVLLHGPNGAGKTNILEAVSLLAPGRGLRRAPLSEMARTGGNGGFAIAARLDDGSDIGTGTQVGAPERRQVRVNGAPAAVTSLSERLSVLWLTPAMDRLFTGPASDRRRFLDRLVLALEPAHAGHASRYEAAMRARTKLLTDQGVPDPAWLSALEEQMETHGSELADARARTVDALNDVLGAVADDHFPSAALALTGWDGGQLADRLLSNRGRDAAAGRATEGSHRQDLKTLYRAKGVPAALSSTGEQKALLLGLVLAHCSIVADRRGAPPILLLDEVAAHLDPQRRAALFERLSDHGQVWMTGTEAALFDGIFQAMRYVVADGTVCPA